MCRVETVSFPLAARTATAARHWVADWLTVWDLAELDDPVLLAVSELVTNAVRHARTPVDLIVAAADGQLEVDVGDRNAEVAAIRVRDVPAGLEVPAGVGVPGGGHPRGRSACVRQGLPGVSRGGAQVDPGGGGGNVPDVPMILELPQVQALVDALRGRGHRVLGPTRKDDVIVLGEITGLDDLPRGWGDLQEPGRYRLRPRDDGALFGFATTAGSAKPVLFPAEVVLWRRTRTRDGVEVTPSAPDGGAGTGRVALFGIRSCDLEAIAVHDRVLDGRAVVDPDYHARREGLFVVAVSCSTPAGTCFCSSTGSGPRPRSGFDLAMTELLSGGEHRFLVEVGSPAGAEVLAEIPGRPAQPADLSAAERVEQEAVRRMGRRLDTAGLREAVYAAAGSPLWERIAARCLACTNCTLVCPTCFCTSVDDVTDLPGTGTQRRRVWDSCFTAEISALHGRSVRISTAARYRQWVTHKFASWPDQFHTAGCVGCGRCITWCPAGIDLTAEVSAVRAGADGGADPGRAGGTARRRP